MNLKSLEVEKHLLSGLLKFKAELFYEIQPFIKDEDFSSTIHRAIFSKIKEAIDKKEEIAPVFIAKKIEDLGISFHGDLSIFEYLDALNHLTTVNLSGAKQASQLLLKYKICRFYHDLGGEISSFAEGGVNKDINEIIANVDAIYSKKYPLDVLQDNKPKQLFAEIETLVEERGNNPIESSGLLTPYPLFNKLYGGLRAGNVYCVSARGGIGKTTFINDICFKTAKKYKLKVLVLDTEMNSQDVMYRMLSGITGINLNYLDTGRWRKNEKMIPIVRDAIKELKKNEFYFHKDVGNASVEEVCAIMRNWYYSEVGRGNQCIIAYDYLKRTQEKVGSNNPEYQIMGEKIDLLHKAVKDLNAPLITAVQANREGETMNRKSNSFTDNSSTVGMSDRIQWIASFLGGWRRKTIDEIALDEGLDADEADRIVTSGQGGSGLRFGTHKLICYKSRFQGDGAPGHHDIVRRKLPDGSFSFENNYLNFNVSNFAVEERGSLQDIVEAQKERYTLNDQKVGDGDLL